MLQDHAALRHRVLDRAHDEPLAELGGAPIAEGDHLRIVVAGVDVQEREGEPAGPERLLREAEQADGVLAAREEERGARALARDLAEDVDRLRLEPVEVRKSSPGSLRHRLRHPDSLAAVRRPCVRDNGHPR
jgi:hypothetical protein